MSDEIMIGVAAGFKPIDEILSEAGIDTGGPSPFGRSWWGRFIQCPYDGIRIKRDGWAPARNKALTVGILFHVCLALYYSTGDRAEALRPVNVVLEWAKANWSDWAANLWTWANLTHDLVVGYVATYSRQAGLLGIEELERADPAGAILVEDIVSQEEPFPYSVRYDVVFEAKTRLGEACVVGMDHKTVGRPDWSWEFAYWQDPQLTGYVSVWNRVMVPKGYPPMKYVIINGVIKPSGYRAEPEYWRYVYDLQEERIRVWELSMQEPAKLWAANQKYVIDQEAYPTVELHRHVSQNGHVTCFDRKYNRGACERVDECLTIREAVSSVPLAASVSVTQPEPEPPAAAVVDSVPPLTVDTPVAAAPVPEGVKEEMIVKEATTGEKLDAACARLRELAKTDQQRSGVDWLDAASDEEVRAFATSQGFVAESKLAVALQWVEWAEALEPPEDCALDIEWRTLRHDRDGLCRADAAVNWQPYHVRSQRAWATPEVNANGERVFWLAGRIKLGVAPDAQCVPIEIEPKKDEMPAPGDGDEFPREIGTAAKAAGLVPVFWLGSHKAMNAKLKLYFGSVKQSSYGVAFIGKDPTKTKLRVLSWFDGMVVESKRNDVGVDTWNHLGKLAETERVA